MELSALADDLPEPTPALSNNPTLETAPAFQTEDTAETFFEQTPEWMPTPADVPTSQEPTLEPLPETPLEPAPELVFDLSPESTHETLLPAEESESLIEPLTVQLMGLDETLYTDTELQWNAVAVGGVQPFSMCSSFIYKTLIVCLRRLFMPT